MAVSNTLNVWDVDFSVFVLVGENKPESNYQEVKNSMLSLNTQFRKI